MNTLYPSSYITVQVRLDGGSWSSPATFYLQDDTEYTSEYSPPYIPPILHQWVWDRFNNCDYGEAGDCVACSLAIMKNVQEHKAGVSQYREYSVGWIYGNRTADQSQAEGMMYAEALTQLQADGAPYYQLLNENANYMNGGYSFPDNYYYTVSAPTGVTAKQLAANNRSAVLCYAQPQRIASFTYYNGILVKQIKQRIIQDGCVQVQTDLYDNCYPHSDGIFPEIKSGSFHDGHMMCIIGWKKIGQKNYWICANSWGDWNGDNGLYYYPFFNDYGHDFYFVTDGSYSYPKPPTPSTAPSGTRRGEGSLSISWGASSGLQIQGYKIKIRRGYDSYTTYVSTDQLSATLTGLTCGCTYYLSVCAYDRWTESYYTAETAYTTLPRTPTIQQGTVTKTSINVSIIMDGGWDYINVARYDANGNYIDYKTVYNGSTTAAWSGLSPGITYKFQARAYITVNETLLGSYNYSNQISITTLTARPGPFDWTYAGCTADGTPVAGTTKSDSYRLYVTAVEWNALVDNVQAVYTYKGWGSAGLSYVTQGTDMSASQFNAVKNAIGAHNPTGIADKVSDTSDIICSDFNTLREKLNGIT